MTDRGVGTNRYAYSNDRINKFDPNGNFWAAFLTALFGIELGATARAIINYVGLAQTAYAVSQGPSIEDLVKGFVISYALGVVGEQLGLQLRSALSGGDEGYGVVARASSNPARSAQAGTPAQQFRNARGQDLVRQINQLETHVFGGPRPKILPQNYSNQNLRTLARQRNLLRNRALTQDGVGPSFSTRQLQHAFGHARDFGISGNWNTANGRLFQAALRDHIFSPGTHMISGTYRGQSAIHYLNPSTGLNVFTTPNGTFWSGWRLSPQQLRHVTTHGRLN